MTALATLTAEPTEQIAITNPFPDKSDHIWKPEEAHVEHREIIRADENAKIRFFLFVARRGHLALGDANLEAYCQRLGISKTTGYRRIQTVIVGMLVEGVTPEELLDMTQRNLPSIPLPTSRVAELLCTLPTQELIVEACTRYACMFTPEQPVNGKRPVDLTQLSRIVGQLMPKPAAVEPAPGFPHVGKTQDAPQIQPQSAPIPTCGKTEEVEREPYTPPAQDRGQKPPSVVHDAAGEAEEDEDGELVFGDEQPDFVANDCEYSVSPAGYWISFTAPNCATQTVFVREKQIVTAATR